MPNHCQNFMSITGTAEDIREFVDAISTDKEDSYRIANILPMPEALEGTTSPIPPSPEPDPDWAERLADGRMSQEWYDKIVAERRDRYERGQKALAETGYTDWYAWCERNWGTKWGDYDTELNGGYGYSGDDPSELSIMYQTAWGPFSDSFFEVVAKRFPRLTIENRYEEMGGDFCGLILIKDGRVAYSGYREGVSNGIEVPDLNDDDDYERYWDKQRTAYDTAYEQLESEAFSKS